MHPQRTLTLHSQNVAKAYGFEEDGVRLLAALPFCGVFGFCAAFAAFAAGKPIVLMDTFDGPTAANDRPLQLTARTTAGSNCAVALSCASNAVAMLSSSSGNRWP